MRLIRNGPGIRNPYLVVTLVPSGNISGISSLRMNGSPLNTFQIRVEGQQANNNRLLVRQDQLQPSVESLQEVSVQTSNFSAEYGQVAGGLFNLVAKSGTNQFHGSIFEYFVHEKLNAGLPFSDDGKGHLVRPPNRRNNFGGSIGGPVVIPKLYNGHNKTFFFFAYERFYQREITAGLLQTLPSAKMRIGDFSEALTGRRIGIDPLERPIMENTIYDPATEQIVSGQVVRDPFPGNIIPRDRLDPVALKITALIPPANRPDQVLVNWDQSFKSYTDEPVPSIKIDHNFGTRGKLSFFYSRYSAPHFNGSDGLPIPLTSVRFIETLSSTTRLNYDHSLTPTLLIHAGFGFVRHVNPDKALPGVLNYDPVAGLGLRGALGKGFPSISGLSSPTGGGLGFTIGSNGTNIYVSKPTAVLSATLVRGNHTYKAGGDWRIDSLAQEGFAVEASSYSFNLAQTSLPYLQGQNLNGGNVGLPYASFMLGLVDNASISNSTFPQHRKPSLSLYVQDNWKITPKLTFDYGLRWDRQGYGDEIHQRISMFSPTTPNPSAGGLPGATIYEGSGAGRCNCTFTTSYPYAIGPRIGVAYRFLPKTVFRAGWGVTFGDTGGGLSSNQATLGSGGWNTIPFSSPQYGAPALILKNGLVYKLADLYKENYNAGIRPVPGQINSPPNLIDPNAGRPPRVIQWNISLQREITGNMVVELAYVGNRGVWFQSNSMINLNANTPERLRSFGLNVNDAADRALLTSPLGSPQVQARGFRAPYAGYPASATLAQSLRPFPQFGAIGVNGAPLGNTWYDSLQMKLTKRLSHGLDVTSTFVWQKELTTAEGNVNNVSNRSLQKTLSELSQPLILMVAFNYQTPGWGRNRWMNAALRGWTVGGIVRYASGLPIKSPIAQNNLAAILYESTYANRVPGQPLFLKDLNCRCIDPNKDFVLNPAAWSQPGPGQFGVSNSFYNDYRYARTPSEQVSLGRWFSIREKVRFQIRAEFFNVLNRNLLSEPSSSNSQQTQSRTAQGRATGGFGYITPGQTTITSSSRGQATPPRSGQLVARIEF
jgi:hypothetical protein